MSLTAKSLGSNAGLELWHSPQPLALKIGPRPSATVSGPVNSSSAVSKAHSSAGICGEFGELVSAAWFAQNSSANPLDLPSKAAGASVGPDATSCSPIVTAAAAAHTAAVASSLTGRLI